MSPLLSILVAIALTFCAGAAEQEKHLFILSGQSNMTALNPNLSFTPTVEAEFGKNNVIVVKNTHGGDPIRCWYKKWKPAKDNSPKETKALYDRLKAKVKSVIRRLQHWYKIWKTPREAWSRENNDQYDDLMTMVNAAITDKRIKTVSFIWMQGESDANKRSADVYAASLKGLLDQLSRDLGRKDINLVIGRISDFKVKDKNWEKVRKAQVEVAESYPRGVWVDTDDLNGDNNSFHYTNPDGFKTLGKRFADNAIELIKKMPHNQ